MTESVIDTVTETIRQSVGQAIGCCGDVEPSALSQAQAERLSAMLKALAHPVRLQIVEILSRQGGEVCVCDVEALFDLKQPTISHHLKILRQAGLINCERRGLWAYYHTVPHNLSQLSQLVAGLAGD